MLTLTDVGIPAVEHYGSGPFGTLFLANKMLCSRSCCEGDNIALSSAATSSQDTESILGALGYSNAAIAKLNSESVA